MKKYNSVEIFSHLTRDEMKSLCSILSECSVHELDSLGKDHFAIEFLFNHPFSQETIQLLHQIENKSDIPLLSATIQIITAIKNRHFNSISDILSLYHLSQDATVLEDRAFISGKDANILFDWKEELKKMIEFEPNENFQRIQERIRKDQI